MPKANKKKVDKPSHIVGIGASAGGLKALQMFFGNIQSETGIAFVIVQHLSPDYKSMMVELLAKYTEMKVERAEDGMVMEANHIYLITPRKNITTMGGKLFLAEQQERQGLNLPIDNFFRSLAEDQGERAIGIILSGTGSDGTRGLRAIKAEGGTVFVQDEESAEFDGMPRCAIGTGLADFILPPDAMPARLLNFISHPRISVPEEPLEVIKREEDSISQLFSLLNKKKKVDFTYYKPATVIRRIERRMGLVQVSGIDQYMEHIHRNVDEIDALFKDLLIGVTKFFRDEEAFGSLFSKAIPDLVNEAAKRNPPQLRVWDVGCSTGEETYSIAMQIHEYMAANNISIDVKIFATDIDRDGIEFAGAGTYPESIAADVDVRYLSKYFEKISGSYRVKKNIRQMVIFAVHNIINDPPFTKIDLVVCRNLLIYLQPVLQKKIFHSFNYILQEKGFLFLGNSETVLSIEDAFVDIDSKNRLYRHRRSGDLPAPATLLRPSKGEYAFSAAKAAYNNKPGFAPIRRSASEEKYYQGLISKVVETMLVVNETRELVQSFGNTERFINLPIGNVSLDILALLPRELSLAVSSAMQRVRKSKDRVEYHNIKLLINKKETRVNLIVDLLEEVKDSNSQLFLIRIDEKEELIQENQTVVEDANSYITEERITDLEREIQFTRENLQATIEELQTTNEELQATNEELLAANEELQSTNEELQSVNEELNTVNAEYQNKVLELTELNTDMDNLMTSSDIPTIFLDKNLCIRKFTPAMTKEINLLTQDIGRPLTDLNIAMFGNIKMDAAGVIKTGKSREKTICHKNEWFLQRILPFIDDQKNVEGVVLTMVRITEQKNAGLAWEMQHNLLRSVLDASPSATVMINREGKIIFVNQSAEGVFGLERKRLLRMKINSKKIQFTDLDGRTIAKNQDPFSRIIQTEKPVEKCIVSIERGDKSRLVVNVNGNPTFNRKKEVDGAVFRIDTIAFEEL